MAISETTKAANESSITCSWLKNAGRAIIIGLILVTAYMTVMHKRELKVAIGAFLYWLEGLGSIGLTALFVAYIIAIVLMIPTTLLNLGAGYVYGVWAGFPVILSGGVVGSCVSFWLGRTLAKECVTSSLGGGYLKRLDEGLLQGRGALKFVFLSRVPPCMPFPVLNYVYGTTTVDFGTYVAGTALGLSPGTFLYVFLGYQLRSLVELLESPTKLGVEYHLVFLFGVTLTAVTTVYLANEARTVGLQTSSVLQNGEEGDPLATTKRYIDDLDRGEDDAEAGVAVALIEPFPGPSWKVPPGVMQGENGESCDCGVEGGHEASCKERRGSIGGAIGGVGNTLSMSSSRRRASSSGDLAGSSGDMSPEILPRGHEVGCGGGKGGRGEGLHSISSLRLDIESGEAVGPPGGEATVGGLYPAGLFAWLVGKSSGDSTLRQTDREDTLRLL